MDDTKIRDLTAAAEAALNKKIQNRIAYHANNHRHTYEIGKGVMDFLARDLIADVRGAGWTFLPVKPNDTVYLIHRRRVVSAKVMFVGIGADGNLGFSVLRGRLGTTAWANEQYQDFQIGRAVWLDKESAEGALAEYYGKGAENRDPE